MFLDLTDFTSNLLLIIWIISL